MLDHRLTDIEDWVFDKSWEILAIGRIVSTYLMFKFLSVRLEERGLLQKILSQLPGRPRVPILAAILFLFISFLILGQPQSMTGNPATFAQTMASYIGSSTVLLSDCLIILILNRLYPLGEKKWRFMAPVAALCSTLLIALLFQSAFSDAFFLFFSLLIAYLLLRYSKEWEYGHALIFCLTFFSPMVSIFGLDPLWKKTYSFLPMGQPLENVQLSILGLVFLIYLTLKRKSI